MAHIKKRQWVNPDTGRQQTRFDIEIKRRSAPRIFKSFSTRTAAETWAREVERDIERGVYKSTSKAEALSLQNLLDRYINDVLPKKKSRVAVIHAAAAICNESIGSCPIIALDSEMLCSYRDKRLGMKAKNGLRGGGTRELDHLVSGETIRKELLLIRRVIEHARRSWGVHLPSGNPMDLVDLPSPSKSRERRLQGDEEERLLLGCEQARSRWLKPAIILLLETGMRRGELLKLEWKDIDLTKRTASLRDTKNGEDRVVPLSSRASTALLSLPRPLRGGQVIGLTAGALSQQWKRLVARAGIQGLRLHDLRHEATSRLFEVGLNVIEVASVTGHKDLQMLKRYTHLKAEDLARRLG